MSHIDDMLMKSIEWEDAKPNIDPGMTDMPYATHSGVFMFGDEPIKCYRLNTGQAIFDADDFNRVFGFLMG